jgi:hypothetical protein
VVHEQYVRNSLTSIVPPIPEDAKLLRIHVSGDFDSSKYIDWWLEQLTARPDVTCWAYTRSWRVPGLLVALERLRALPNVQLFASMDVSCPDMPPPGWRIAWIDGDPRAGEPLQIDAHSDAPTEWKHFQIQHTESNVKSLICPEETKAVKNCEECGYCFDGKRNDVTFLKH